MDGIDWTRYRPFRHYIATFERFNNCILTYFSSRKCTAIKFFGLVTVILWFVSMNNMNIYYTHTTRTILIHIPTTYILYGHTT